MLASERITARALIERRVRAEVAQFNARDRDAVFRGLIAPATAAAQRGGFRLERHRPVDADQQCQAALTAFNNGFVMRVDDRKVEALDDEIVIGPDVTVSFVKLVPLVAG